MMTTERRRASMDRATWTFVACLLAGACSTESDDVSDVSDVQTPPLCGECSPLTPEVRAEVESRRVALTDCEAISSGVALDRDAAREAGFDVVESERRFARGIAAPLRWEVHDTSDATPSGFATETQITATITVNSFRHVRPDPKYCDGSTCRSQGIEIDQAGCPERLEIGVTVALSTADGSLRSATEATAVQWKRDAMAMDSALLQDVAVSAETDLKSVRGGLQITPNADALPAYGVFVMGLRLGPERTTGTLRTNILSRKSGMSVYTNVLTGTF